MRALLLILLLLVAPPAQAALTPDELLADPAQEERARALGRELRCLVCQNQSIDDSDAELARDLRRIVRERVVAGDSDEDIRRFLVARYGDFVLLEPPMRPATYLLWYGPLVVLVLGGLLVATHLRRRRGAAGAPAELDAEERRRLDALLEGERR
jgi:cytochrome c-type biogenesis protein CcmH